MSEKSNASPSEAPILTPGSLAIRRAHSVQRSLMIGGLPPIALGVDNQDNFEEYSQVEKQDLVKAMDISSDNIKYHEGQLSRFKNTRCVVSALNGFLFGYVGYTLINNLDVSSAPVEIAGTGTMTAIGVYAMAATMGSSRSIKDKMEIAKTQHNAVYKALIDLPEKKD